MRVFYQIKSTIPSFINALWKGISSLTTASISFALVQTFFIKGPFSFRFVDSIELMSCLVDTVKRLILGLDYVLHNFYQTIALLTFLKRCITKEKGTPLSGQKGQEYWLSNHKPHICKGCQFSFHFQNSPQALLFFIPSQYSTCLKRPKLLKYLSSF